MNEREVEGEKKGKCVGVCEGVQGYVCKRVQFFCLCGTLAYLSLLDPSLLIFPFFIFRTHGRYSPADHRMMSLLSYLSRYQPSTGPCIPLHAFAPQIVNWADLALHVTHAAVPNSQILYSLNASVVGLCCVPEEMVCFSREISLLCYFF